MASTRWLLVLMLWLLPRLQMVKSGYSVQKFKTDKTWDSPVVIPKDGVYLVSLICSPCKGCKGTLEVYCLCRGQVLYIVQAPITGIYTHAEVAVGLKKSDKLFLNANRAKVEAASSLSVVYVAELNSFYITALNSRLTSRSPVTYTFQLRPDGWLWLKDADKKTTFNVPATGMYWVIGHARPLSKSLILTVRSGPKDLFFVYGEKVKPVSTSGAFRLTAGSTILMVTHGGVTYQAGTSLSVVYLAGNKKPNTYPFEHLAFTAKMQEKQIMSLKLVIDFKRVLTNYGYMYIEGYTEIRRTGSYMISLRPDPESASLVTTNLYINGKVYWLIFAQQGVPTGATISLELQVGSYLHVKSSTYSTYGSGTMFSVAFIQP